MSGRSLAKDMARLQQLLPGTVSLFSSSAIFANFDCLQETQAREIPDSVSHLLRSFVPVARLYKRNMRTKQRAECLHYESTGRAAPPSGSAGVKYFAESKDPLIRV
jgi:hypothetical protein